MDALVKKHSTSSMAACTGFFTMIMASADTASIDANTQKRISTSNFGSPVSQRYAASAALSALINAS